ncbi:type II toxin-antitoxin system RelE/ParE family toxin [Algoriphagus sp. D3-2-R+10]|uniref:type II toxin-antitoxin system RelE/ParE family toxin n=1 Tax=Algoriphagus aurantiacus TaxID=3103948 RepID=UPI003A5CF973
MKVIWTNQAQKDYDQNIDYLLSEWSEKVAQNFIDQVNLTIQLLTINPYLYQQSNYQNIRKAFITKQILLFYKPENKRIVLIRFWNNSGSTESLLL